MRKNEIKKKSLSGQGFQTNFCLRGKLRKRESSLMRGTLERESEGVP